MWLRLARSAWPAGSGAFGKSAASARWAPVPRRRTAAGGTRATPCGGGGTPAFLRLPAACVLSRLCSKNDPSRAPTGLAPVASRCTRYAAGTQVPQALRRPHAALSLPECAARAERRVRTPEKALAWVVGWFGAAHGTAQGGRFPSAAPKPSFAVRQSEPDRPVRDAELAARQPVTGAAGPGGDCGPPTASGTCLTIAPVFDLL
jgi:hypothetical protein